MLFRSGCFRVLANVNSVAMNVVVNDPEKTIIQKESCTTMFIGALFTLARTRKQPKCPSIDERIKKMWHIYKMEYYSAVKRNIVKCVRNLSIFLVCLMSNFTINTNIQLILWGFLSIQCHQAANCPQPQVCPQVLFPVTHSCDPIINRNFWVFLSLLPYFPFSSLVLPEITSQVNYLHSHLPS